jgi:hypothetical protein
MGTKTIEDAICAHICERDANDSARYDDLKPVIAPLLPVGENADFVLSNTLPAMIQAGKIETFEDEERGTVYVRDC